ncbi:hypothetical protein C3432_20940 [Citrobacter amalonaticus]|uniref:Uncharacterized protein n=1 Tax=Citrobacter amalonaticus TaxID=35703 RepID=A0A2S4RUY7_CITAM|nr:hypothetical protein [Citrobacter amalonaticus]POT55522.1 hypothetical protein C3432_20940 [Citrobacter amalonaticus]POT73733.1 hypothetical protein C3436_18405 [Citrobacter amalonaticus]POU63958.1 hypothetical protein C3430_17340 [Citrobacter amalonaticus]POV03591.1 hypothetical protein C3424_20255 [Citrobacter amalonaticus]
MKFSIQSNQSYSFVSKAFSAKETVNLDISVSRKNSFFCSCVGVSNTYVKYDLNNGAGTAKLKLNKVFAEIEKAISSANPTSDLKNQWVRQECITMPSSEINKLLDTVCINLRGTIKKESKASIFSSVSSMQSAELDVNSAQSSIKHVITGNHSVKKTIAKLQKNCETNEKKNLLSNAIVNDIAERFYDKTCGQVKLSAVRQQAVNAFMSEFNIKQELNPSPFGTVRESRHFD